MSLLRPMSFEKAKCVRELSRNWRYAMSLTVVLLCGVANFYLYYGRSYEGALSAAIRKIHPAPTVMGMTTHVGPYIREVRNAGGKWVGSFGQTFVPGFVDWYRRYLEVEPGWEKKLAYWDKWTAAHLVRDMTERKPDMIIIVRENDFDWFSWTQRYQNLRKAMSQYRLVHTVEFDNGIFPLQIYLRNGPAELRK